MKTRTIGVLLTFPFIALALGPLYIVNVLLRLIQPYTYLYVPRLTFGARALLYVPLILATTAWFKVAFTTRYSREVELRRNAIDARIATSDTPIVICDDVPRKRLTVWERLDFFVVLLRIMSELGDGIVASFYETIIGRARKLNLTDENVEFLFTDSSYNNLFDEQLRRGAEPAYVVDMLAYDDYEWEEGYFGYGCRGTFEKTSENRFVLREVQFGSKGGGLVVTPGHEMWKVAKLHLIVCCNNEMLFNFHANEHLNMMQTGVVVDSLRNTRAGRVLAPHFRYLPALDENIMNTLYTPDSAIYPTALKVDAIIACYKRGNPAYRAIKTFRKSFTVDCRYREFESEAYEFMRDFAQQVAEREYKDDSFRALYEGVVKGVFHSIADPYSKEALGDLLAFFLTEILILTDSEHYQVRRMGFYRSTMKTCHKLDATPVKRRNLEFFMDALQRIMFRVVFSGDFPMNPVRCSRICGYENDKLFDRARLKALCAKYPEYTNYDKLSSVLDY